MTIYGKGCISNYRNCSLSYVWYSVLNRMLTIPNGVMFINEHAFSNCTSLHTIDIANSVQNIDSYAFSGCTALQSIDIPNSITDIGDYIFEGCISLCSIRFRHNNIEIEKAYVSDDAFEGVDFETCTLYIPSGTRWAYRHHPIFSKFKNIVTEIQK